MRFLRLQRDASVLLHVAIILTRVDRPYESSGGRRDQHQPQGYQEEHDSHATTAATATGRAAARRAAFNTTATELTDIPSAATQGAMYPAAARGTIVTL